MIGKLLQGRRALVTGAGSGIGAAIAARFAEEGAEVALLDINRDNLQAVTSQIESSSASRVFWVEVDLRQEQSIVTAVDQAARLLGGLDIVINNAGIGYPHAVANIDAARWDEIQRVNLLGPALISREALRHLASSGHGSIVMVSSLAAKRGSHHGGVSYTASKAGLLAFARQFAYEAAAYGIRVNTICPGPVLTPMVEAASTAEHREETRRGLPLGRWVAPEDVANAAVFFASDLSKACTGTDIDVDAGFAVALQPYEEYFPARGISYEPGSWLSPTE